MRMFGACWPARVDKGVVQPLLDVVNDPLFEFGGVIAEQTDPSNRFF